MNLCPEIIQQILSVASHNKYAGDAMFRVCLGLDTRLASMVQQYLEDRKQSAMVYNIEEYRK